MQSKYIHTHTHIYIQNLIHLEIENKVNEH